MQICLCCFTSKSSTINQGTMEKREKQIGIHDNKDDCVLYFFESRINIIGFDLHALYFIYAANYFSI